MAPHTYIAMMITLAKSATWLLLRYAIRCWLRRLILLRHTDIGLVNTLRHTITYIAIAITVTPYWLHDTRAATLRLRHIAVCYIDEMVTREKRSPFAYIHTLAIFRYALIRCWLAC